MSSGEYPSMGPDADSGAFDIWSASQMPRVVRVVAAETRNLTLERESPFMLLKTRSGERLLRCHVRVADEADQEQACEGFAKRLQALLQYFPEHGLTRVVVEVTGHYPLLRREHPAT